MASPTISFAYRGPESTSLGLLKIEQKDWSAYTGVVTKSAMLSAMRSMLYAEAYQSQMDCGMDAGAVVCEIHVYPLLANLKYQFEASYGHLGSRVETQPEITETINFSLVDRVSPQYPPRSIRSANWIDDVYDVEGNVIPRPTLRIDNQDIVAGKKVYGSVEVVYTTELHTYSLRIERRESAIDNYFSAAVYGWYAGGCEWLVVDLPHGIAAFEADATATCGGWSGGSSVEFPDDYASGLPVSGSRESLVDYCTQQIIKDEYL